MILPPHFFLEQAVRRTPKTEVVCETAGEGSYAAQSGARWLRHHIAGRDGLSRIFWVVGCVWWVVGLGWDERVG